MSQIIKIRRGTKAALKAKGALLSGEMGFCTDTKEVFIGDGANNIFVGKVQIGALNQRPAPGTKGRLFSVDLGAESGSLFIDTGSSWLKVNRQIDDSKSNSDTLWSSEKIKNEIELAKRNIEYQDSVITRGVKTAPSNPAIGERYIVTAGEGSWAGINNSIVEWNGAGWESYEPQIGWTCYVDRESKQVSWNGSQWVISGGAPQSIEAGNGLLGGGQSDDISIRVGEGNGIIVQRDSIAVKGGKGIIVAREGVQVNVDEESLVIGEDGKVKINYKFKPEEFHMDGEKNISLKLIDGGTF